MSTDRILCAHVVTLARLFNVVSFVGYVFGLLALSMNVLPNLVVTLAADVFLVWEIVGVVLMMIAISNEKASYSAVAIVNATLNIFVAIMFFILCCVAASDATSESYILLKQIIGNIMHFNDPSKLPEACHTIAILGCVFNGLMICFSVFVLYVYYKCFKYLQYVNPETSDNSTSEKDSIHTAVIAAFSMEAFWAGLERKQKINDSCSSQLDLCPKPAPIIEA